MKLFSTEIELFDQMAQSNYVASISGLYFFSNYLYSDFKIYFFPLTYNVPDNTAGYLRSKKKN